MLINCLIIFIIHIIGEFTAKLKYTKKEFDDIAYNSAIGLDLN